MFHWSTSTLEEAGICKKSCDRRRNASTIPSGSIGDLVIDLLGPSRLTLRKLNGQRFRTMSWNMLALARCRTMSIWALMNATLTTNICQSSTRVLDIMALTQCCSRAERSSTYLRPGHDYKLECFLGVWVDQSMQLELRKLELSKKPPKL